MSRARWFIILILTLLILSTFVGAILVNGDPVGVFLLPTRVPTIPLPTSTPAPTSTSVPVVALATATCSPTPTPEPTATPTDTPTRTPTTTPTKIPIPTALPTDTPTRTPTRTDTPLPTSTATPVPPPVTVVFATSRPLGSTPTLTGTTPIPTPVNPVEVAPGSINIVLLGSDRRPDWEDWHTDVVQLVSIQPMVPAVTVLSIPRDLYVYIPGFWMSRINFADMYGDMYGFEGGGFGLLQQTMLYNLGIPVDHYVRTDFDGLIGIVDGIGGIDVPVHCRLQDHWPYPDENGEYPIKVLEPGMHHLDGESALWYARSRMTSSTFARERRQQQVLQAIWRKSRNLDLLPQVPQLWEQFQGMIMTDMTFGEVATLAGVAFRLEEQNVRFRNIGYQQVTPWVTPHGGSVFLPNWEELEPVVAEALGPVPEGRMWRKLHTVEVWNGVGHTDWDQLAADRLMREGFGVVISDPDRRDYAQTQLIDFSVTAKGSAASYLRWMFNVAPSNVTSAPDPDAPFPYRLIIGSDYDTCRQP